MSKSEHRIQQEIVVYWNNTYPQYRGLLCYNLNNSVGGYRGKQNKFLGLVAGRSDLVLYLGGVASMIELKASKGAQSVKQKEWQALIESQGFKYFIIRSLDEFKSLIGEILGV